jgi:PKD repeat protein
MIMKTRQTLLDVILIAAMLLSNLTWLQPGPGNSNIAFARSAGETPDTPDAAILYVKPGGTGNCSSWASACELRTALATAVSGDQVWVAAGIFKPTNTSERWHSFYLNDGVKIYGGFPGTGNPLFADRDWEQNRTILSGDIGIPGNSADNSYTVVNVYDAGETTVLDGFTIQDAMNTITGYYGGGGGMRINDSSVHLENITFYHNQAVNDGYEIAGYGGGLYLASSVGGTSNPSLTNVRFYQNSTETRGGGMYCLRSNPLLTEVTFSENSANQGGGMYSEGNSPVLKNVTFFHNTATSALYSLSWGAGMVTSGSNPVIINATFFDNIADSFGGGMYIASGSSSLTNVTFTANRSLNIYGSDSGGIRMEGGILSLTNAILWGNFGNQLEITNGGTATVTYSDMQGSWTGTGNINADPRFAEAAKGNLRLQTGSPAINTGNNAAVPPEVTTDQDGSPRKAGTVDMGAYEAQTGGAIIYVDQHAPGPTHNGSSWNNAFTGLQPALATASSGKDIWVADGTYRPGVIGNRKSTFRLKAGVDLYGGFLGGETSLGGRVVGGNITILKNAVLSGDIDADGLPGNNAYHVLSVFSDTLSIPPELDGFTVTAGNADGASPDDTGGGLYSNTSSPALHTMIFKGNQGLLGGGAGNVNSDPTFTNVIFLGNHAVNGGGMYNKNCTVTERPKLVNVLFNANAASGSGGGMYTESCPAELTNVTMTQNHSDSTPGGGVFVSGTEPVLNNSLLWGNSGPVSASVYDQQLYPYGSVVSTTIQASSSYPSPFMDADGADNLPGTPDDDLRLSFSSTYAGYAVIDAGDEIYLPADTYDLDYDTDRLEKLPIDLEGKPRITIVPAPEDEVDRGAYEAGCWVSQMQHGYEKLIAGQGYRQGFHDEIDDPSTITISDTLSSYASERYLGNLGQSIGYFEKARQCAETESETLQANQGMLKAIWERATGAMLEGNEKMVQALDVTNSQESAAAELELLSAARDLLDEATRGYLEPLAAEAPGLLETLAISRTHPINYTTGNSMVDLERLAMASEKRSRAALELAERQFRLGLEAQAEQSLREGALQALAEMVLMYNLWPDAAETVDYAAMLRNLDDMSRLFGYMKAGKNPLGYDADFIPFSYHPTVADQNNYIQTRYIAQGDLLAAGMAVEAAAGKQQEADNDYRAMQSRLYEARTLYESKLVELCGAGPGGTYDQEDCASGDIQEQVEVVESAMLQIERVLQQMESQNTLIRIEQERIAAEKGIRYATAQLITDTGEKLADLARQEVETERKKSAAEGIMGAVESFFAGSSPLGVATPSSVNPAMRIVVGGITAGAALFKWNSENEKADDLADIAANKERMYAKQQATVQYAEGDIADASSLALQRQYMLKFAELDIDLAIAMNNMQKEMAQLVGLRNQAAYALAEKAKAQAFTALLYRDPAARVLRERYMELAHYRYERALVLAYKTGKALEYEINEDVTYSGLPLSGLDDIYPLQDINYLTQALEQIDDAYTDWLAGKRPSTGTYDDIYLSLAVGFEDTYDPALDRVVTREEKFNAFLLDPAQRFDRDEDGCSEVEFSFQTSIQPGNMLGLSSRVYNDKIQSLRMRVYGTDLFYSDERETVDDIRLVQGGTTLQRTGHSLIHQGGADDLRIYNLDPKTIIIQAAANASPIPQNNSELFGRGVASTNWTINIEGGAGASCGDLNLDAIQDIRLYIDHEYFTLQSGPARAELDETPAIREYRPIQRPASSQKLSSPALPLASDSPAASVIDDLNGLFVGTVVITRPMYISPGELAIQLSDDHSGMLTGYISPTLMYPVLPENDGKGPMLFGAWGSGNFSLTSLPFTSDLFQSDPITQSVLVTRTIEIQSGIITTSAVTCTLSGVYIELWEGLTPEPLEMRGVFELQRPLRRFEAAFGASPRTVAVGNAVHFTDLSFGNPTSWLWDFGDGGTSTDQNPVHAYSQPGDKTVSLTIGDGAYTHTLSMDDYISVVTYIAAPQADFIAGPLSGPAPLTVHLTDTSIGGATSWLWDFGDGSSSTQQNPTHVYIQPGSYTVKLTASNPLGGDTIEKEFFITVTQGGVKLYIPIVSR